MRRIGPIFAALLLGSALGPVAGALAQTSSKVPVEADLRREQRIERNLGETPVRPEGSNVTPTNPSGVAGFDGPPGTVGDSANSYGSLPHGVTGSDIR